LILFVCFGLHHQITIQLVRCKSPLTGDRCAQLAFRASVALQPILFLETKRPDSPPGLFWGPCDGTYYQLIRSFFNNPDASFSTRLRLCNPEWR